MAEAIFAFDDDVKKGDVRIVLLSENAKVPMRTSRFSAGYDIYSPGDYEIPPNEKLLLSTDLQIAIPYNCHGRIEPLFDLTRERSIDVCACNIDSDFRYVIILPYCLLCIVSYA